MLAAWPPVARRTNTALGAGEIFENACADGSRWRSMAAYGTGASAWIRPRATVAYLRPVMAFICPRVFLPPFVRQDFHFVFDERQPDPSPVPLTAQVGGRHIQFKAICTHITNRQLDNSRFDGCAGSLARTSTGPRSPGRLLISKSFWYPCLVDVP